jgi:hypothetical protein
MRILVLVLGMPFLVSQSFPETHQRRSAWKTPPYSQGHNVIFLCRLGTPAEMMMFIETSSTSFFIMTNAETFTFTGSTFTA